MSKELEECKELYAWHKYYGNFIIDVYRLDTVENDRNVYNNLYKEAKNILDEKPDLTLAFRIPKYIKVEHDMFMDKIVNPGLLKLSDIDYIKNNFNSDTVEMLIIKGIIYSKTMSTLDYSADEVFLTPIVWPIYLVQIYDQIIKEPKFRKLVEEYIK